MIMIKLTIFQTILVLAFVSFVTYLLGSFACASFNIGKWDWQTRSFISVVLFVINIGFFFLRVFQNDGK